MKRRKPLARPRAYAFKIQSGKCFYCGHPMWNDDLEKFALKLGIEPKLAKWLRCTGEHLIAHKDGGLANRANIVAACLFCNKTRHLMKSPPDPENYKRLVQKSLCDGRWHPARLSR